MLTLIDRKNKIWLDAYEGNIVLTNKPDYNGRYSFYSPAKYTLEEMLKDFKTITKNERQKR